MQRRYFGINAFCNPVNASAFAVCGGDEIVRARVTVRVIKEWPNGLICLSRAFFFMNAFLIMFALIELQSVNFKAQCIAHRTEKVKMNAYYIKIFENS